MNHIDWYLRRDVVSSWLNKQLREVARLTSLVVGVVGLLASEAFAQQPGAGGVPMEERTYTLSYVVTVMMVVLGLTAALMPSMRTGEVKKNEE
ncbi:MAG: hypothetical protein JSS27_12510 [Planctomycetes bacterium]|nr:hypothetical protein [Planctomycetota bacterium]